MVPVIHGADQMSLNQLSEALGDLSSKAREGKLPPQRCKEAAWQFPV